MTIVTGSVKDLGKQPMDGVLYARAARFLPAGDVVYAPERVPYQIAGGAFSVDLAPGPAVIELKVGSHARDEWRVVVPDQATVTLAKLLEEVFPWEPAQVSQFVAQREAAEQAKRDAAAAAADAETKRAAAKVEADRAAQERQAAAGHREHVDGIREQLDEAAQGNVAPYLTQTALNATYGTKAEVAQKIDLPTATQAISSAVSPVAAPVDALLPRRGGMSNVYSLLAGTPDETLTKVSGNASDTITRVTSPERGWKLGKIGGGTTVLEVPLSPGGITVPPSQAVGLDFTISDVAQFVDPNYLMLRIYTEPTQTAGTAWGWVNIAAYYDHRWRNHSVTSAALPRLVTGKNRIRVCVDQNALGVGPTWGTIHKIELVIRSATTVDVTFNHLFLETPKKARMLVVADRGYDTFDTYAYPKLKAAGIPVTFAVDPGLFGTGDGQYKAMSEARIHEVARENNNSISFHAWQGQVTSTLTGEQLQDDTARCIKWLQKHGYSGRMWRAAFTQGNAPEWAAVEDMVLAARSGMDTIARNISCWPAIHPMKIPAQQIDNFTMTSNTVIDQRFDLAKRTHGLIVPFFHAVGPGTANITAEKFDYWLSRAQAGIAEGWLEPVTFEQLFFEMGGQFTNANGANLATWVDVDGTMKSMRLL